MSTATKETLKTGDLAFLDSMAGMIPCKVLGISGTSGVAGTQQTVLVVLTANRGAFKRGESLTYSGLHIIPRKAYSKSRRTIKPFNVKCDYETTHNPPALD